MDKQSLYQILHETTVSLRKGEEVEGDAHLVEAVRQGKDLSNMPGGAVHIYAMPHVTAAPDSIEKVDCHFIVIGVDKQKAEAHRAELLDLLKSWPTEAWGAPVPKLEEGPSYIHVGGVIDSQEAAFQLFALGQVLGLWRVVTPATLGITGNDANIMAGMGMVMISGYKPAE